MYPCDSGFRVLSTRIFDSSALAISGHAVFFFLGGGGFMQWSFSHVADHFSNSCRYHFFCILCVCVCVFSVLGRFCAHRQCPKPRWVRSRSTHDLHGRNRHDLAAPAPPLKRRWSRSGGDSRDPPGRVAAPRRHRCGAGAPGLGPAASSPGSTAA